MKEIPITSNISYLPGTEHPLSAEIGIIRDGDTTWLYDVGNGEEPLSAIPENSHVVLSHFHPDHMGNIGKIQCKDLYVSPETNRYLPPNLTCTVHLVTEPVFLGPIHIFPIPSSHAKGCLALEYDQTYTFLGDALYCRSKNGRYFYNSQLLQSELHLLKSLPSPTFLSSHHPDFLRSKESVLNELQQIYSHRTKNSTEIPLCNL